MALDRRRQKRTPKRKRSRRDRVTLTAVRNRVNEVADDVKSIRVRADSIIEMLGKALQ